LTNPLVKILDLLILENVKMEFPIQDFQATDRKVLVLVAYVNLELIAFTADQEIIPIWQDYIIP
jgi:hypothetical protein